MEQVIDQLTTAKPWYERTNKGYKVNTGILARYLIDSVPVICIGSNIYMYENGVYTMTDRKRLETIAKTYIEDKYCTIKDIKNTVDLWITDEKVQKNSYEINTDPYIVNLSNGLFDLKEGILKDHTPQCLSTIQMNVRYSKAADCQQFIQFLNEVLPDYEDQKLAQEIFGYALTLFTVAEKFFVLYGPSRTGKSTLLSLMEAVVDMKNVSHVSLQNLNDRFSKAQLQGKILNIFSDLPSTALKDTSIIKALVGRDTIQVEKKNKDPFDFTNQAKLVFAANSLPEINDETSEALLRRLIIVPFNQSIPEERIKPHLKESLINEMDGIFNWALEGLNRLLKNNFIFTESKIGNHLMDQYRLKSNSVLCFVDSNCLVGQNHTISKSELYSQYERFCSEKDIKPVSKIQFKKLLVNKYPIIAEKQLGENRTRSYVGINLKEVI